MATGLGSPNAANLVTACSWYPGATQGIFSPVANAVLGGTSVAFQWGPYPGATNYWLDAGSTYGGNNYEQSGPLGGNACALTVKNLPQNGSPVYVTWWYYVGGSWQYTEYQYTSYGGGSQIGVITSPAPGGSTSGSTVAFTWNAGSLSSAYWLTIGSVPGGNDLYNSGNLGNVLTKTVTGLPTNGQTLYVTLFSDVNGQWPYNQYTYTAGGTLAQMQSPTPGTEIDGTSITFTWSAGTNAQNYWLDVGSFPGGHFIWQSGPLGSGTLMDTVTTMPNNGEEVYVTLWTQLNGSWYYNAYTYQSGSNGDSKFQPIRKPITSKVPGRP